MARHQSWTKRKSSVTARRDGLEAISWRRKIEHDDIGFYACDHELGKENQENCRAHLHHRDGVVIEHCRDIFGWELVCCVTDEQTSLADGTITDNNASVD